MLVCKSRYRSSLGAFQEGDVIDDVALENALIKDSPESFGVFVTDAAMAQAEDKMIRRGRPKKVTDDEN